MTATPASLEPRAGAAQARANVAATPAPASTSASTLPSAAPTPAVRPLRPAVPRTVLLRARFEYAVRRVGPVGWFGIGAGVVGLVLGVAALQLAGLRSDEALEAEARVDRLATVPANPALAGAAARARPSEPSDPISAVVAQLPADAELMPFAAAVQALAVQNGVRIDRTEYRVQRALGDRALRYQLVLPAHGAYPRVRSWLDALLLAYPTATLDELQVQRAAAGGGVDARIAIGYFTRSAR
jgi:hypothetical protein